MTCLSAGIVAALTILALDFGRHPVPVVVPVQSVVGALDQLSDEVKDLRQEAQEAEATITEIERETAEVAVQAVSAACESVCE